MAHPVQQSHDEQQPGTRATLLASLRRIDGWGPVAWREVFGLWSLGHDANVLLEPGDPAAGPDGAGGPFAATLFLPAPNGHVDDDVALADWALRRFWRDLQPRLSTRFDTLRPAASVRATSACHVVRTGRSPILHLRGWLWPTTAGMCIDATRFIRVLAALRRFAAGLPRAWDSPALRAHVRTVRRQRLLRAALDARGWVAFLADGARIARDGDDRPAAGCRPLRAPPGLAATVDLGRASRVRGLPIPAGVTAIIGAPYHGKSTVLAAIAAGRDDHPPGDGREGVVCIDDAWPLPAEDGRLVKCTDVSTFFRDLPGSRPDRFATRRASGATSMAAGAMQAAAAGARLLLIDEDSAAGNFLAVDAGMRRLLGRDLDGHATLAERLRACADAGVSTVVVAGASSASLPAADRVILMRRFAPTAVRIRARRRTWAVPLIIPPRVLCDDPEVLLRHRHTLDLDTSEPERPAIDGVRLDLRRCGWALDDGLVRGALLAAAWCTRLAAGGCPMHELRSRWLRFSAAGPTVLDPYGTTVAALPPWPLVAAVLERLPQPLIVVGTAVQRRR